MHLETEALVLAVRPHGEHGAIARLLTPGAGVQAGYVRGGKSRRVRPLLMAGNRVHADFRSRTDDQLAFLSVELVRSRAFLLGEPLPAAGIEWACGLTATVLPEGQAYSRLFDGLDGLLGAIEAAPSARGWATALVRYELTLLAELGFGVEDEPLAALPPALLGVGVASWEEIVTGLAFSGGRVERDLFSDRRTEILAARERLIERIKRVRG
jgi:DNA repair protein RecO (recombination protein O)